MDITALVAPRNHEHLEPQSSNRSVMSTMSDDTCTSACSSINSFDASLLSYPSSCELLESRLKTHGAAKNFHKVSDGMFSFESKDLTIELTVRRDDNVRLRIDFSCVVYAFTARNPNEDAKKRTSLGPYALMTKMMKYKAKLNRKKKQEQLGKVGDNFVFVRSLRSSLLREEKIYDFGFELDSFISTAHDINKDFNGRKATCRSTAASLSGSRRQLLENVDYDV